MSDTPVSLLDQLRQQPDEAGWRRLVELYTPLLQSWLRHFAVQPADADDLIQETLTALFRELPHFQHKETGAFRRWLRTTLVHRVLPFFRARKRLPSGLGTDEVLSRLQELEDPNSDLAQMMDLEHDRHVVRQLLGLIQEEFEASTWRAFQLLGLEGASAAEAAQETGISANAATIAKCRVLNRLRQLVRGLVD